MKSELDFAVIPDEQRSFIEAESNNLTQEIAEIKVTNRENYEKALTLGIANSNILKRLEDLRKAMIAPYEAQTDGINQRFKGLKSVFEGNDEKVRASLLTYQKKVDVENIKTIQTDLGSATIQERKDFDVLDETKVPREFLKVDETKIRKAVNAGLLDSNGWIKVKPNLVTAFKAK